MERKIEISIEAPANMALLRPLNLFVRELVALVPALSETPDLRDSLELAFDEAFTNIHRHAYRSSSDGPVTIQIKIDSDRLEFRFEDQGESFDPTGLQDPDLDTPAEGGLGVWIIRQVMDEFIYSADDCGRNVLRLVKRFSSAEK